MSSKLSLITLIIPFLLLSQWQVIPVDNSGSRFCDVCVVNQDLIWAVKVGLMSNICKTTNQGLNWQIFDNLHEEIYFISAVDENTAWVSNVYGDVYKTTNGGSNWVQQVYSPKSFINFLKFFNGNTGFFVADPVNDTVGFFYTRNGGTNWTRSLNSPIISYSLALLENCANAFDTNFIWICAQSSQGVYKFYSLKNGLNSEWNSYSYGETGGFRSAVFKDYSYGLVASSNKILFTSNGGINWQLRNLESIGGWPADFLCVPGTEWVILNSPNNVKISKDFGLTWLFTSNYGSYDLYYSDSRDTNSIWLAYNYGKLLKYNFNSIGIIKSNYQLPDKYYLRQNYPNPFNPTTYIEFDIMDFGLVKLKILDVLGKEIETIVEETLEPGTYKISWDASMYSSGVYFYILFADDFRMVRKMIVVK